MDELTLKEKELFDELKKRVGDEVPAHLKDDVYLYIRFLRAREFNLDLSEDMLRKHLIWRKANNIDNILTDFVPPDMNGLSDPSTDINNTRATRIAKIEEVMKYCPLTRMGFDKDGAVVRYFAFGNMDTKGILKSLKRNECILRIIKIFEEDVAVMKRQSEKVGKPVEQWVYVLNFENYTFAKATHKPTLEALISLFMQYEANYPERLKAAYIINASVYFSLVFSIIKPLLSGNTLRKIQIFGKEGWKEELRKNIDLEVLPEFLGGSRTDPDGNPMCNTFINHGEFVPEELYSPTKTTNRLSSEPGVKKLNVSRMSKVHIMLDVAEPDSLIEWEFETESKDIGFGLFYKNTDSNKDSYKELVPKQRIDTQIASEVGMYQCDRPGTYILVFDNSYSWLHQKEIYCKASVVTPTGQRVSMLE